MNNPKISIYVAMDEKRGIGRENKIPWHIKEDLVRLKQATIGHTVILGRTTYESMLWYYAKSGRPTMSQRRHIVITHNPHYIVEKDKGIAVTSIEQAIATAKMTEKDEIFILGGARIFEQTLPLADKLYITVVKGDYQADTFFPDYSAFKRIVHVERHENAQYHYSFLELIRN